MFATLFLCAAPVPPPPPLSADLLAGQWHYTYGGSEGTIAFARGTYFAQLPSRVEFGDWWIDDRGDLILAEWAWTPTTEEVWDGKGFLTVASSRVTGPVAWCFGRADLGDYRRLGVVRLRAWCGDGRGTGDGTAVVLTRGAK